MEYEIKVMHFYLVEQFWDSEYGNWTNSKILSGKYGSAKWKFLSSQESIPGLPV